MAEGIHVRLASKPCTGQWLTEDAQNNESAEASSTPESLGLDHPAHPEFRSHTKRKSDQLAAKFATLYRKDQGVWLLGARSMKGMTRVLIHLVEK
jgi:hypothetical protein